MENNNIDYLHQINAIGVLGHDFAVDAPFLTNPFTLEAIDYLKSPLEVVNLKSFDTISDVNKQLVYEQASQLFMLSPSAYAQYQQEYFYPNILTADNCDNPILCGQYGLFAKKTIMQYQVIGFYSGIYATSYEDLEHLVTKYDFLTLGRYGNACLVDGIPVILGHHNGNYMTIINDYRPFKWYEYDKDSLEDIKNKKYNTNSIVLRSGDYYFVAYLTCHEITPDTELSTDYGDGYWLREKELIFPPNIAVKY